jgi:hypothetical protein
MVWKRGEEWEEEWECNGGTELVQGALYFCMKWSQWNPLMLSMYDKSKIKFDKIHLIKSENSFPT